MARGRMFDKNLVCKDKFRQLSAGTQLLYFHLCMNADDEGFVDNTISLIESLPVNIEDLRTLLEKKYVMPMDNYLYVIKHWRLHNRIDKAHYSGTEYLDYLKKLYISENREYSLSSGINLYEHQKNRGYLSKISDDITEYAQTELNLNSNCTNNILKISTDCTQKEPQLSKDKLNLNKENKVNVNTDVISIRSFLDSHNLTSLDSRYEFKIAEFFKSHKKNEDDLISYLEYVFSYSIAYHPNETGSVDAKLFYSNSFQIDVLNRFYSHKTNQNTEEFPIHWPNVCPVCKQFHELNGKHEICTLDLSKSNSNEDIEEAKKQFEKYQEVMRKKIRGLSVNLINNVS